MTPAVVEISSKLASLLAVPVDGPEPARAVAHTRELERVLSLPRRMWREDDPAVMRLVFEMSEWLRRPGSRATLRPIQAFALAELYYIRGLFGPMRVGSGKCVDGATVFFDPSRGRRRADETGFGMAHTVVAGRNVYEHAAIFPSGEKECFRLELADGANIEASFDHPVFTARGWVEMSSLQSNDLIAVARSIPEPPSPLEISDDDVRLLAYLLSDGGLSQAGWSWTNARPTCTAEFLSLWPDVREKPKKSNCREFALHGNAAFSKKYPEVAGLSKHKRLPAEMWRMSDRHVALFLHRFFSCDGYYNESGVETTLASEGLIDDLNFLLRRLGIHGRKRYKTAKIKKQEFDAWRLAISGADVDAFLSRIGMLWDRKPLRKVPTKRNTNVDVVPIGRPECYEMATELGLGQRGARGRTDLSNALSATGGQFVSRRKFESVCHEFDYHGKFAWLAASDVSWERVTRVDPIGVRPVYDLSVNNAGCFFGNSILVHNTLITFLAPTVLDAKRPVLCIPAKLREKTKREFERLSRDWRAPASLQIFSYTELSRDYGTPTVVTPEGYPLVGAPSKALIDATSSNPDQPIAAYYAVDGTWWPSPTAAQFVLVRELGMLDTTQTDLFIGDEIHHEKNPKAACTRKTDRFMRANPMTPAVLLSGTITKDKIQDFAHIALWALKGYAPVPRTYHSIQEWGRALNVKVADEDRLDVGALIELASTEDLKTCDPVTAARRGFRRRLIETPGVVAYAKQYDGASLLIEECAEPKYAQNTEADFAKLRNDNVRADGSSIPDGLGVWAYARQRALGFYYTVDPPPPLPWKNARTEWHAAIRQAIKLGGARKIDSEWQVANACALPDSAEKFDSPVWKEARRAYAAWLAIRDTFKPNQIAVWCDDAAIRFVADWMANNRGLVWIDHIEFAERLSQVTGAPFFHEKGNDATGRFIEEARPGTDGSIIVSIESNNEGRNLQEHWSENFFTTLPKGGNKFEQALGRTHRDMQTADEVTCDVAIWCREQGEGWLKILEESRYMVDSTMQVDEGEPLPAKVFYADRVMPDADELFSRAIRTARFR